MLDKTNTQVRCIYNRIWLVLGMYDYLTLAKILLACWMIKNTFLTFLMLLIKPLDLLFNDWLWYSQINKICRSITLRKPNILSWIFLTILFARSCAFTKIFVKVESHSFSIYELMNSINQWINELVNYASLWFSIYKVGLTIMICLGDKLEL
jgi:hypothetical protein